MFRSGGRWLAGICFLVVWAQAPIWASDARCDWALNLYTGVALTADSSLEIDKPDEGTHVTLSEVVWEDYSLTRPSAPYAGARLSCFLRRKPWLGINLDFFHFKVFAETERMVHASGTVRGVPIDQEVTMNQIVERYQVGNGVNMLLLGVVGRQRLKRSDEFPQGRVLPYFGGGVGPAILYTQSTVTGQSRGGYELGRWAGQIQAGVAIRLNRRWDAFAEYKYTYTRANGSVLNGESLARLDTNHFVVGAGFHF